MAETAEYGPKKGVGNRWGPKKGYLGAIRMPPSMRIVSPFM